RCRVVGEGRALPRAARAGADRLRAVPARPAVPLVAGLLLPGRDPPLQRLALRHGARRAARPGDGHAFRGRALDRGLDRIRPAGAWRLSFRAAGITMSKSKAASYWDYIRVEELLALQGGLVADEATLANEEVLFITVHQLFELAFKLVLRELRTARELFCAPYVAE